MVKQPNRASEPAARPWLGTSLVISSLIALAIGLIGGLLVERTTRSDRGPRPLNAVEDRSQPVAHTVAIGETLSSIGLTYRVPWEAIAAYNEIPPPYQVKAGTVLNIPPAGLIEEQVAAAKKIQETEVGLDLGRLTEAQHEVAAGRLLWRLDPIEVIKRDAPIRFQFDDRAIYFLKSKDGERGEARVDIERGKRQFEVHLVQPIDRGPQGVWAIKKILGAP